MSESITYTQQINEKEYTVVYHITKNVNTIEPNLLLFEYGVHCAAYHLDGTLSSEDEVKCVSPNLFKVQALVNILACYHVFPLHLRDIISDLLDTLTEDDDYFDDVNKSA